MTDANQQGVIFGTRPGTATVSWFRSNPARSNQYCLYCGEFVGAGAAVASDKEHLVGRRMVPVGTLGRPEAFNFIFRACIRCNAEKATFEDHISAITLLGSAFRADDPAIDELARRKALNSYDPRYPGSPVAALRHESEVKADAGAMSMTFGLVAGAQPDPHKLTMLAFRHVQGLFSLVTSENPLEREKMRILPGNEFGLFRYYPLRDWGNPQLLEVAKRAHAIPRPAEIKTADGFFRASLRREDADGSPWFWALEWNASYRLVGWIGNGGQPTPLFEGLPPLEYMHNEALPGGGFRRLRFEIPLADETPDLLFDATN